MSEHEEIRQIVTLAAAEVLDVDAQLRVERHARECSVCRKELEVWREYARGLGHLPQPSTPLQLLERTHVRILGQSAAARRRRFDDRLLVLLALFSWAVGLSTFFILRFVTGGLLQILGTNVLEGATWTVGSTIVTWTSVGAAALVLAKRRRELRSTL